MRYAAALLAEGDVVSAEAAFRTIHQRCCNSCPGPEGEVISPATAQLMLAVARRVLRRAVESVSCEPAIRDSSQIEKEPAIPATTAAAGTEGNVAMRPITMATTAGMSSADSDSVWWVDDGEDAGWGDAIREMLVEWQRYGLYGPASRRAVCDYCKSAGSMPGYKDKTLVTGGRSVTMLSAESSIARGLVKAAAAVEGDGGPVVILEALVEALFVVHRSEAVAIRRTAEAQHLLSKPDCSVMTALPQSSTGDSHNGIDNCAAYIKAIGIAEDGFCTAAGSILESLCRALLPAGRKSLVSLLRRAGFDYSDSSCHGGSEVAWLASAAEFLVDTARLAAAVRALPMSRKGDVVHKNSTEEAYPLVLEEGELVRIVSSLVRGLELLNAASGWRGNDREKISWTRFPSVVSWIVRLPLPHGLDVKFNLKQEDKGADASTPLLLDPIWCCVMATRAAAAASNLESEAVYSHVSAWLCQTIQSQC
jgi:hypothetical protein